MRQRSMARMEWGNEKRVQAVLVTKGKLFYLLKSLELIVSWG